MEETEETTTTAQPEKEKKKDCPQCEMDGGLLTAYGAARTACELMEDEKEKKRCREWADLIDPEKIESEVELIKETLRYPEGPSALKKHAMNFNIITKRATIELVEEKMQNNEPVSEELMGLFRQAVEERKV